MRYATIATGLWAIALGWALNGPAFAEELAAPTGEVILSVSGQIAVHNAEATADFDQALLAGLAPVEIKTSTIWTDRVHSYTGVPLKTLVDALGISGSLLRMTAIDEYMIEVPMSDAVDGGPILAYLMDGQPMSVRDKGPVWLIYPFDDNSAYRSEVYYARSIWQLNRIEAVN